MIARGVYLGIDHSYSGYAIAAWQPSKQSHTVLRKSFPIAKYDNHAVRLSDIQDWLEDNLTFMRAAYLILGVAMEGYAYGRRNGREEAGELGGVTKVALYQTLPAEVYFPLIVSPTALKKYVCGTGKAEKSDMKLNVFKKWGVEFKDDNEADAYGLARLSEAFDTNTTSFKYEQDVLTALKKGTK